MPTIPMGDGGCESAKGRDFGVVGDLSWGLLSNLPWTGGRYGYVYLLWGFRRCVVDPSHGPKVTCCVMEQGDPHAQLAACTCHGIVMCIVIDRSCGPLLLPRHMDRVSGPRDTFSGDSGCDV